MKELTKAEEQIMQVIWEIKKGFVKDVLEHFPEPKPAYTTISTIIRTLEKKGFVSYRAYGKTHEYYPLIPKQEYQKLYMRNFLNDYFEGSFKKLVSFFAHEDDLDVHELEELLQHLKQDQNKKRYE